MSALPRKPLLLTLPRATRLYRACTLAQLAAMPLVDLDVALATLWKRIDELHRSAPHITKPGVEGKIHCIARCAQVAVLEPLKPPSKAMARVMENTQRIYEDRHWPALLSDREQEHCEVLGACRAAVVEFLEADGRTPKKAPFVTVTEIAERGFHQETVSFSRLWEFLGEQGLHGEARRKAVRLLVRRGMPVSGSGRTTAPRVGVVLPSFDADGAVGESF